jgi:hypothetical protein
MDEPASTPARISGRFIMAKVDHEIEGGKQAAYLLCFT